MNILPTADTEKGNAAIRENLKKEIKETIKTMSDYVEKLKVLESEKIGLCLNNEEMRLKLIGTAAKTDFMKQEREDLMNEIWKRDAEAINRACKNFGGADKDSLVDIMSRRSGYVPLKLRNFTQNCHNLTLKLSPTNGRWQLARIGNPLSSSKN